MINEDSLNCPFILFWDAQLIEMKFSQVQLPHSARSIFSVKGKMGCNRDALAYTSYFSDERNVCLLQTPRNAT